jgi:hypothetical protein
MASVVNQSDQNGIVNHKSVCIFCCDPLARLDRVCVCVWGTTQKEGGHTDKN